MAEIRNPNLQTQGPGGSGNGGDMRSMLGFTAVALAVLLGYQYFFAPKPAPNAPTAQTQQLPAVGPMAGQAIPPESGAAQSISAPGQTPSAPAQAAQVAAAIETETTIENEQYKIVFTNRGAQIKHWFLKKYNDTAGKPLDMVQQQTAARFGFPLSLFTYDPAIAAQLNQALYQLSAVGAPPSATGQAYVPQTSALAFHYAANGLDAVKTVRFDSSYVIAVETEVTRNGAPVRALVQWPCGLGDMEEFLPSASGKRSGPSVRTSASSLFAWSLDGKQSSQTAASGGFLFWTQPGVSGNATFDLPYQYAAIADLYFASAFLPEAPERATLVTLHNTIDLPTDLNDPKSQKTPAHVLGLAMGDQSGVTRLRLFAGPKQLDVLKTVQATDADGKPNGQSLEPLIQFGFWGIIAKPLYLALRYLHEHLGAGAYNWGWAIIIVTVIFNLLMLPTRFMMMKSSLKMMRIQPKVEALKKRYAHLKATDPKRAEMNAEMMQLYKDEGVNMYGSCLPMLVQMPLFFAYYRVLYNAVELRQAHWFWLHDLSIADPFYILPGIIIVSMFLTQIITPQPGVDPNQRRMMAFMMPVVMGFTLMHFASGLALYWCTGNLIQLALQLGINQSSMGKEMHAIAAKRAAKKAGGNLKTIQGRR